MKLPLRLAFLSLLTLPAACMSVVDQGVEVNATGSVQARPSFTMQTYGGRWYEVARLDHPFQRGLIRVTSTHTPLPDARYRVVSRGYDPETHQWREAHAVTQILPSPGDVMMVRSYGLGEEGMVRLIAFDEQAGYAMVGSADKQSLWILSRKPTLDPVLLSALAGKAQAEGYNVQTLTQTAQR